MSRHARAFVANESNIVLLSAATAWEIATKVRLGRLSGALEVAANLPAILIEQGFEQLAITVAHGLRAGSLPDAIRVQDMDI